MLVILMHLNTEDLAFSQVHSMVLPTQVCNKKPLDLNETQLSSSMYFCRAVYRTSNSGERNYQVLTDSNGQSARWLNMLTEKESHIFGNSVLKVVHIFLNFAT